MELLERVLEWLVRATGQRHQPGARDTGRQLVGEARRQQDVDLAGDDERRPTDARAVR